MVAEERVWGLVHSDVGLRYGGAWKASTRTDP